MVLSTALSRYFVGAVILVWIPLARSQCTPSTLMATCQVAQSVTSYLETDILPSEEVTISCDSQSSVLSGWSHAPGTAVVTDLLDITPSKYRMNGNTLTITNISRTDEGVYRCIYEQGNTIERCVYVYGRALFASCPENYDGCPDDATLSVVNGDSVHFDATVVHTPGGSCGFRQEITNIQLMKINPEFVIDDELLLSCSIDPQTTVCSSSSRVSLSRGNDPGYEFVFTLNNASLGRDDGMYRVDVQVTHPTTSSTRQIMKSFTLEVSPRPTGSTNSPTTTTVTGAFPWTDVTTDTMEQRGSPPNQPVIIGVLVLVVLILIATAIAIAIGLLMIYRRRNSKRTDPPGDDKAPESHFIAQEENRDDGREEKVLFTSHEERPPPYNPKDGAPNSEQLNIENNKESPVIEPSLYDNRCSLIESDFHLPTDSYLNSKAELVTICEGNEYEHTGRVR